MRPFHDCKAILRLWPVRLEWEHVTTAADDVHILDIADSRPFALREGPLRITLFADMLRKRLLLGRGRGRHRPLRCISSAHSRLSALLHDVN